jgi:hypothetical protein
MAPASLVLQGLAARESVVAVRPRAVDAENLQESPASAMEHGDEARALAAAE